MKQFAAEGNDIFKNGDDGRQGGKRQEHKKQGSPQPAERHPRKNIGNDQKNQTRAGIRIDAE